MTVSKDEQVPIVAYSLQVRSPRLEYLARQRIVVEQSAESISLSIQRDSPLGV